MNATVPVLSIVIPVHNKEAFVSKTIQCVLDQTYKDFELILVNDGSNDLSGDICNQYALLDSRIKVIHQKNGGVSNARNTGIKASKNELIAFLDADDYWNKEYLSKMTYLIDRFPEVDIYSSKYAEILDGKIVHKKEYFSPEQEFVLFDLIERCAKKAHFPIHSSSVIIRKKIIELVGYFDERINCFEDFDLFVRISLRSKVAYLNQEPLSFYNLDVPADSKARGILPNLKKHWITYMDKFNEMSNKNEDLKLLLDRSILSQLLKYNRTLQFREEVKGIIKKVHKNNFPFKYKLIYYTPVPVGDFFMKCYLTIKKSMKDFCIKCFKVF